MDTQQISQPDDSRKFSDNHESSPIDFPVVGIGASAGGLEALQEFFKSMPEDPGVAFIIVQHLSPDYKSLMDELLARHTKMVIHRVEDGMMVEENHIYLIPPRMNMTIFHGKLLLTEQAPGRSLNLPIDIFLRSLAKDQEKNAIGIILSGTGSDGTLGIRAIKEFGGIAMVQDDQSAKFDGMPRSSISTGMVDLILPPAKLADELVNYVKHPLIRKTEQIEHQINKDENQLSKVISILRDHRGVDFSNYKEATIIRRLEKRISINRFDQIDDYVRFLADNPKEINFLFNELLIGVTRFFRDEDAFNKLSDEVLGNLFKQISENDALRLWVAGCSTGEEAYSIAILLKEYMQKNSILKDVKIFATDIDTRSLEYAGTGLYPDSIASDISPDRINKYFTHKGERYQVNDSIRSMVIFARHNILQDPPFSKIDLISCRNLLIYLNNHVQQKVLAMFYLSLVPSGYLFLGSSESLGNMSDGFTIIDNKSRIYRHQPGFRPYMIDSLGIAPAQKLRAELKNSDSYIPRSKVKLVNLESIFSEILGDFAPPSVIVDENLDIVHTIHQVSKFVTLPVGQVSLNLIKMLPKELGILVSSLLRRAEKSKQEVVLEKIEVPELIDKLLTISCKKIADKKSGDLFYIVSFIENERKSKTLPIRSIKKIDVNEQYQERIEELERELQYKSENLQAAVEELETSNEELQSSNEELIASNEELQSTNEELQSVNEELYTVNSEHLKKIEELTEANADMDNLLKNTHIGTLFLDRDLTIRKVNKVASELTNILNTDIGRPIHHLSYDHLYKNFIADVQAVIESLKAINVEVQDKHKNWYLMRIIPYRTAENAVDGIIITFVDTTSLRKSEYHVQELSERLRMAMEVGGISHWEWNCQANMVTSGDARSTMIGYEQGEIGSKAEDWARLIHPDDQARVRQALNDHFSGKAEAYEAEYRIRSRSGEYCWYKEKGGIIKRDVRGKPLVLSGVVMNITSEKKLLENKTIENKQAENVQLETVEKYDKLFSNNELGVLLYDHKGKIIGANPAAERILGISLELLKNLKAIDPGWKTLHDDGSDFPGKTHPVVLALATGITQTDVVMGLFNPLKEDHIWISVSTVPLFRENEKKPYQVYSFFHEITLIRNLSN
ncbi:MAG: PAS domain-containing protein [Bacteroidetes bacterium]|nr:PAS domain-containing protein [Bacteroidota bacterium]